MRIERKVKLDYKPITITLETEREAEMLMQITGLIAGSSIDTPRGLADKIYQTLGSLGVDYRDENFKSKFKARGTIIFDSGE
ncbi:hypothetical protein UFOVP250_94 [uncultured Caudovirales phage]|uniref:Uncharacterized protein n=1 Tax=uncultured Caudovirales phage TaxID=2100421 RepID=A0A6J5LI73_9CAUD|nr:hypothetical protein UFOVP250_94 [uncultured Caudovirales phage]